MMGTRIGTFSDLDESPHAVYVVMAKISRKRFQEALRALKQACKNDRLPFTLRVHAAELICSIYGVPVPQAGRIKRTVKELVEEGSFDRQVREQVNRQVQADAEREAREFLQRVQSTSAGETKIV